VDVFSPTVGLLSIPGTFHFSPSIVPPHVGHAGRPGGPSWHPDNPNGSRCGEFDRAPMRPQQTRGVMSGTTSGSNSVTRKGAQCGMFARPGARSSPVGALDAKNSPFADRVLSPATASQKKFTPTKISRSARPPRFRTIPNSVSQKRKKEKDQRAFAVPGRESKVRTQSKARRDLAAQATVAGGSPQRKPSAGGPYLHGETARALDETCLTYA
jgi:hypothetical protein